MHYRIDLILQACLIHQGFFFCLFFEVLSVVIESIQEENMLIKCKCIHTHIDSRSESLHPAGYVSTVPSNLLGMSLAGLACQSHTVGSAL